MTSKMVIVILNLVLGAALVSVAEEKLSTLKVGSETYTNVTITSVTATDLHFSHSRGIGNAKLKNLDPELQKKFRFDPVKASAKQKEQAQAQALYNQAVREAKPPPRPAAADEPGEETVPQEISANAYLNQPAPTIVVQKWLTEEPDFAGKFVIIDFWATWAAPCKRSIPELNALYHRFKDRLVVAGLSDEPEEIVRAMKEPVIDYYVGIDTLHRSLSAIQLRAIPHSLLIDPKGIVRFEGHPSSLTADRLEKIMDRYSQ